MKWHQLSEADDAFIATAPLRYEHTVDIAADVEKVWARLSADDALVSWSRLITGTTWTSPRPFSVGTTRDVVVGRGVAALRERYFHWDEHKRMTFTAVAANRPAFRRFAEDISLTSTAGGTRVTWVFAIEPRPATKPMLRLARRLPA